MRSRADHLPGSRAGRTIGLVVAGLLVVVLAVVAGLWLWVWSPGARSAAQDSLEFADGVATGAPGSLFASDEEALAAATEAYSRYQAALDHALAELDDSALDVVAEGSALGAAKASVAEFSQRGVRQAGETSTDTVSVVSRPVDVLDEPVAIQIYVCVDVTHVDVSDATGASQLGPASSSRYPFIATLTWQPAFATYVVSSDDFWAGENFCD